MPADALQANDISRSDFMRRKVLFWWARYINTTQRAEIVPPALPTGVLRVPAFGRSGFLHHYVVVCVYFFGVPAINIHYTVCPRSRCVRKISAAAATTPHGCLLCPIS